eukprot:CAMPEP_0174902488 /NCGR_PEP_ID=MMETSP0167-20121228/37891_1 /TAXON_ID=38298 /ORGANISM="Rhodella maculata, Strain CCMP736" /LENGTH=64 /DNA_ID=CAMNT_0016144505 /DNA_START=467 /DNA_END=658 /DNA_ORIENTATION=-
MWPTQPPGYPMWPSTDAPERPTTQQSPAEASQVPPRALQGPTKNAPRRPGAVGGGWPDGAHEGG